MFMGTQWASQIAAFEETHGRAPAEVDASGGLHFHLAFAPLAAALVRCAADGGVHLAADSQIVEERAPLLKWLAAALQRTPLRPAFESTSPLACAQQLADDAAAARDGRANAPVAAALCAVVIVPPPPPAAAAAAAGADGGGARVVSLQSLAAPSYQLALQRGAGGADAPVAPPTILQLESYLEYLEPTASAAEGGGGGDDDEADDAAADDASGGGASVLPALLPTVLKLVRPPQRDSGGDGEETLRNATLTLRAAEAGCVLLRAAGPRSTPPEPLVAAIGKGLRAARSQMSQALPAWGQYAGQKLWAAPATAELLLALTAYPRAAAALCTPRWCEERDDGWRDKLLGSLNDQLKTVAWGLSVLAASARERNERAERAATAVAADFAAAAVARPRLATLDSQDDWMADEPQGGGEEGGGGSGGGSSGPTEEEIQVEAEAAARRAALGALIAWLPLLPAAALLKGDTRQLLSDGLACACNHAAIDTPTRLATLSAMAALVRRCDAIPATAPQAAAGGGGAIVPMEVEGASRSSTAELSRWVEVAHSFFHPLGDAAKSGDDAALCAALDAAAAFASRGPSMVARRGCVLELRSYGELMGHVLKSCASRGCFGPPPKIDRHPLQPRTRLLLVVALRAHLGLRDALESLRRHDRDADGDATGDGAPYSGLSKLEELNEVIKEETIENLLMTALGDAHGAVRAAAVDALPALIARLGKNGTRFCSRTRCTICSGRTTRRRLPPPPPRMRHRRRGLASPPPSFASSRHTSPQSRCRCRPAPPTTGRRRRRR